MATVGSRAVQVRTTIFITLALTDTAATEEELSKYTGFPLVEIQRAVRFLAKVGAIYRYFRDDRPLRDEDLDQLDEDQESPPEWAVDTKRFGPGDLDYSTLIEQQKKGLR